MREPFVRSARRLLAGALLAYFTGAGCGGGGGGGNSPPASDPPANLIVTPQPINVPTTQPGTAADLTVTIELDPTAQSAVTISSIGITGDPAGVFTDHPPALPATIQPGQTISTRVTFAPQAVQSYTASLEIKSIGSKLDLLVPMSGQGGQPTGGGVAEFQVNRSVPDDQWNPRVAALDHPASNGAVAVAIYEDLSALTLDVTEGPHEHVVASGIDANGNAVGPVPDPKILHHTEGIQSVGICAEPSSGKYVSGGRRHPSNVSSEPHPNSFFMNDIGEGGDDFGGLAIMADDPTYFPTIPGDQDSDHWDVACDNASATRFHVWRLTGGQATAQELQPGLCGRIMQRNGTPASPVFLLSSAPLTGDVQTNEHIAFNGLRYLVVWEQNDTVVGRLFLPDGTPVADDFTIAASGATPEVCPNTTTQDFFVVWQGGAPMGALVSNDGVVGAPVQITTTFGATEPRCAANSAASAYKVVWVAPDSGGTGIFTRTFDSTLTPTGTAESQVNDVRDGQETDPAVTFVPSTANWLAVWTGLDAQGKGIKGRFLGD
jgi:hypothetical protein